MKENNNENNNLNNNANNNENKNENKPKSKKKLIIILSSIIGGLIIIAIIIIVLFYHFIGFQKCVGNKKYSYTNKEVHIEHGEINLYGRLLIPKGEENFPIVIYSHGAESNYKADITTLKSLSMSGITCYTFDFYGWSTRTTGPKSGDWFKKSEKGDKSYEVQVLEQVKDLDDVIEKIKNFEIYFG